MQKQKKNFALLLGIFLFNSCGSLPKKPKVEICAHNEPFAEVECYDNQTGGYRSISVKDTDRYIMYSPDDWGLILLYIKQLEKRVRSKKIKRELKKIITISEKHSKKN